MKQPMNEKIIPEPFSSPGEFLSYVRTVEFSPENRMQRLDLQERQAEILSSFAEEKDGSFAGRAAAFSEFWKNHDDVGATPHKPRYSEAIENVYATLLSAFPSEVSALIEQRVSVSTAETGLINAAIHASPTKHFFAVVLNSALVELLHKLVKLQIAARNPEAVIYCNRSPGVPQDSIYYTALAEEYVEHFRQTKRSNGPLVYLNDESNAIHITSLNLQELFIVGHELGHLISGDFFGSRIADEYLSYIDNPAHRREHMADLLGAAFAIEVVKQSAANDFSLLRKHFLLSLIHLFDIFALLEGTETDSHPHPIRRLYCIVDHLLGAQYTDIVARSYDDKSALLELQNENGPEIDSVEEGLLAFAYAWVNSEFGASEG